jgi:cell fate regulator YaaT (PSP1 superfamily)
MNDTPIIDGRAVPDCEVCCPVRSHAARGEPLAGAVVLALHPFKNEMAMAPAALQAKIGDWVVFTDDLGEDIGRILGSAEIESVEKTITRRSEDRDLRLRDTNQDRGEEALKMFRQLVQQFRLPMKPVAAHLRLDRREICFYFVSEDRLNFRALHKAISSALNIRVSIRQVGIRDYTRIMGGVGPCGRVLCCTGFLTELKPITLRMARQQSLFVEPAKISGICGKLLCCLGYEEQNYRDSMDRLPKAGTVVKTPRGRGRVIAVDIFSRKVTVALDDAEVVFTADDLRDGSRPTTRE